MPGTSRGRPASIDVPFGPIAEALEDARTARVHSTTVVGGYGRDRLVRLEGLVDFGNHLTSFHAEVDGRLVEHLEAGPDVLHRLSAEE